MFKVLCFMVLLASAYASKQAVAYLKDAEIEGTVTFTQLKGKVQVEGVIKGLPKGEHGFHVHEKGDLTKGCTSAGAHFNPLNKKHGAPADEVRHVGDLGNIVSDSSKVANINITDPIISLDGEFNIIGRALVVHENPDDLGRGNQSDSLTTGHAGGRVVCAVIGIQ